MERQKRVCNKAKFFDSFCFFLSLAGNNAFIELVFFEIRGFIECFVDSSGVVHDLSGLPDGRLSDSAFLGKLVTFFEDSLFFLFGFEGDFEGLDSKLPFLGDRHVWSGGSEALSKFVWVVGFHGHADPRELHPDPPFVVIVRGGFLVELEFFLDSFCVQVFKVGQVLVGWLRISFFGLDIGFYFVGKLLAVSGGLLVRLHIVLCFGLVQGECLFLSLEGDFLQKWFDLIVIVFPEIVLVALHLNVKLLHSDLFLGLRLFLHFFTLLFSLCRLLDLHFCYLLYVLTLLYFVVHFFQLLLVLFLFIILTSFLVILYICFYCFLLVVLFAFTQVKVFQLP